MGESSLIKIITTFLGTCIVYLIGGLDLIFSVLLIFIVADYATGLMKGFIKKELSSAIGYNGIMKKVGILIAIIVAHQLDKIAPGDALVRTGVISFFVANEGISLTENLAVIGVPVPDVLLKALRIWKEKGDETIENNPSGRS